MMAKKEEHVYRSLPRGKIIDANASKEIGKLSLSEIIGSNTKNPEVTETRSPATAASAAVIYPKATAASLVEAIRQRRHSELKHVRIPTHPAPAASFNKEKECIS